MFKYFLTIFQILLDWDSGFNIKIEGHCSLLCRRDPNNINFMIIKSIDYSLLVHCKSTKVNIIRVHHCLGFTDSLKTNKIAADM